MQNKFMELAIELSIANVKNNTGGPFGAVIVKNNEIIATGINQVTKNIDPTAHAEVMAIRNACQKVGRFHLTGCEIYTSCQPCPMCLSAIYWAHIEKIYYANTKEDAAKINFDDSFIYQQLSLPEDLRNIKSINIMRDSAIEAFNLWQENHKKIKY